MARGHRTLGQRVVELLCRLHVRRVVLLHVGVRADRLGLRPADDHARASRRGPADERHDARTLARVGGLEQANRHAERHAAAPLSALVRGHGPRVALQVLKDRLEREAALGDGQEEAADRRLPRARLRLLLGLLRLHAAAAGRQDAEQVLHLLRRVLLRAAEHVGLGALGEAELMHHDVCAECDEPDERVLWDQVKRLLQRVLQLVHLFLIQTRVHHEEEHGRTALRRLLELVLDRRELRDQLRRQVVLADVLGIVGCEVVAGLTERTRPELGTEVDLAVWVEHARTSVAPNGIVRQSRRHGRNLLERRVETAHRHHNPRGFET
mmetsp:Transcript_12375/g.21920  ORF Transcript_12375/g.21920 Transcript_12375/m.21920 type:complete len:324 (-) Transcript_12375:31-1002(-)